MVPGGAEVKDGEEVGRLAGRGEHGRRSPFQGADLGGHPGPGWVLQTGVEVALGLQVEQGPHGLAALVAEGGALDDGDVPGLPVAGGVASVDALGAFLVILHGFASSLGLIEYLRPACKRAGNRLGTKYYTAFPGLWSIPRRKVRESFPAWMLRIGIPRAPLGIYGIR